MYINTCVNTFRPLSSALINHRFIPRSPIPTWYHRVHSSFLPFHIYNALLWRWEIWFLLSFIYLLICSMPLNVQISGCYGIPTPQHTQGHLLYPTWAPTFHTHYLFYIDALLTLLGSDTLLCDITHLLAPNGWPPHLLWTPALSTQLCLMRCPLHPAQVLIACTGLPTHTYMLFATLILQFLHIRHVPVQTPFSICMETQWATSLNKPTSHRAGALTSHMGSLLHRPHSQMASHARLLSHMDAFLTVPGL